jgi:hypothetical protein
MLLLLAFVIGLAAGIATGGKVGNVANLRLRWPWVVLAALVVREVAVLSPLSRVDGVQYVYVAALIALVAWTAWHSTRLRGAWIVAIGAALNLVVVIANGARMPVATELAGSLVERGHIGQYVVMGRARTGLAWRLDGGPRSARRRLQPRRGDRSESPQSRFSLRDRAQQLSWMKPQAV